MAKGGGCWEWDYPPKKRQERQAQTLAPLNLAGIDFELRLGAV